jgi:hypothetical protein
MKSITTGEPWALTDPAWRSAMVAAGFGTFTQLVDGWRARQHLIELATLSELMRHWDEGMTEAEKRRRGVTFSLPIASDEFRERLRASIQQHGIMTPLICNQDGMVVVGGNRLRALWELQWPAPIPIVRHSPFIESLPLPDWLEAMRPRRPMTP